MTAEAAKKTEARKISDNESEKKARPPAQPDAELIPSDESDDGKIQISNNVIAAVVRKYTLEVDGVVRFASTTLVGGLAEMIGRRNQEGSVQVHIDGEAVNISVTLVLRFGVKVPDVASLVQEVIRTRVEELTGKHVTSVDVIIQDLEDASAAQSGSREDAEE